MAYTYNVVLGVTEDSTPVVWNWDQENALAIVGKGGSGKTTGAIYWLAQLTGQGVRVVMCDPHMAHIESLYYQTDFLHGALVLECARTNDEIMRAIEYVYALGMKRINNETSDHFPLVLVMDEFTSFLINYSGAKDAVLRLLDGINQFRKVNIRLFALAQTWTQALRVASSLRDNFSSAIVLKSSVNDARKFCVFEQTAKEATQLRAGEAFYNDEKIYFPRVTSTGKLIITRRIIEFDYPKKQELSAGIKLYSNEHNLLTYV